MFICEECLKEEHKWQMMLPGSYGKCEDCGKVAHCVDGEWEMSKHSGGTQQQVQADSAGKHHSLT